MTIKEKIQHQSLAEIRLYLEGTFWTAYEQSAYYFHKLKGYKPTKKFIKVINQEVVSVGFPENALSKMGIQKPEVGATLAVVQEVGAYAIRPSEISENGKMFVFRIVEAIDEREFLEWKAGLELKESEGKMVLYDQLPVYKATYDLLVDIFQLCQNMERDYKFTIGEELKKEVIKLIMNVYRANSRRDGKLSLIGDARENAEVVRLMLRLLQDLKQIKEEKRFVDMNEKLESISKQLTAWQRKSLESVECRVQSTVYSLHSAL